MDAERLLILLFLGSVVMSFSYLRFVFFSSLVFFISSCGATQFIEKQRSDERGAQKAQLTGDEDCYQLGNDPYQGDTPHQGKKGGKIVVVDEPDQKVKKKKKKKKNENPYKGKNPCIDEPNPYDPGKPGQHPGQNPGQNPGQHDDCDYDCFDFDPCDKDCFDPCHNDCDDHYKPIDDVTPWPGQQPVDDDKCGKDGLACGNPGQHPGQWQWPGQTIKGHSYDRGDVEACIGAFQHAGYDTKGMWGIDVRTIKNVSILSDDVIQDNGRGHNIVIIKSVGVLGVSRFRLMNPNALYCIKSTNVLEDVRITSCHTQNVVFGRDINVLSRVDSRTVKCQ